MNNENQWERPTLLRGNRSNLIEFPVNALPPILREMANGIARTTSTDVSMAATAILSSVSYCFSGQFRIIGKKDHSEPLVIDSLIVAEASFKKSPVMKLVSQPYQDYVQEYNEKNKSLILEKQAKKKVLANKLSALEKNPDADTKEMSDLSLEFSKITGADFRRIIVDDITPESLVRQLAINGTLLMIGHYFRLQAIYAYGLGDTDNQTLQAERILAKVRSKNISEIRQNDLYKLCRCKLFKNAQEFSEVIAVLEEYGYLRSETIPAANGCNRSGVMLRFNPNIYTR